VACVRLAPEDEGFAELSRISSSPEVMGVLLVCGTSSTVGVADPRAVPQPK
jgi:hypothetical protein